MEGSKAKEEEEEEELEGVVARSPVTIVEKWVTLHEIIRIQYTLLVNIVDSLTMS